MPEIFRIGVSLVVVSIVAFLIGRHNISALDTSTTVVILNWSRPHNVKNIVSHICTNLTEDDVRGIIIWNNSPIEMTFADFSESSCSNTRLRIINSPQNLYFLARYIACSQANTRYCFIQDDDYLVLPEIIQALIRRMSAHYNAPSSIHLQPPHEMLSSELRTLTINSTIHATFAWLGYGTIIQQSRANVFLALLDQLGLSDDQQKMADNYFTVLSNNVPERWFDLGIELGGGVPFTVGAEGEERNNRHITEAAKLLETIITDTAIGERKTRSLYTQILQEFPPKSNISRAPCHGRICIFVTSVQLLPDGIFDFVVSSASDILKQEKLRLSALGERRISDYINFAPSNAVDGTAKTVFRSPQHGKRGEWVMLDSTQIKFYDELHLIIETDGNMGILLQKVMFEFSEDGSYWTAWKRKVVCTPVLPGGGSDGSSSLTLSIPMHCTNTVHRIRARYLRLRLLENADYNWVVHEMYIVSAI